MKMGRFVIDTHVHAQRFAAGSKLKENNVDVSKAKYDDLRKVIDKTAVPYDNSPRLLYDMECYGVDMCVLLPAFGMTNEINAQLVEKYPDKFVALCQAVQTAMDAKLGKKKWTIEAACKELDEQLSTGKFVGIGECMPVRPYERGAKPIEFTERLDQYRAVMEVAQKYKVPVRVHTGTTLGYNFTPASDPDSYNPLWVHDIAVEYPDVPIIFDHGGLQAWWSERLVEECLHVVASTRNVYLEVGYWWTELYYKALLDPNVGAEKMLWGTDWGASIPIYAQPGHYPATYPVQVRKNGIVKHQVDCWGWSLRQMSRLDISQDDMNLILGGNAARIYKIDMPYTRLFRPVE